jgi:predicted anti-sigma-YlaC factor YlaD
VNCKEIVDFLMDYLEGELPENVHSCFDTHLQSCPSCVDYLNTYRTTILVAKSCCHENPAHMCDEVPEPLIKAILAARKA